MFLFARKPTAVGDPINVNDHIDHVQLRMKQKYISSLLCKQPFPLFVCLTSTFSFTTFIFVRYVIPLDVQVAHYTPAIFPLVPMISPKINKLCENSWKKIVANKEMTETGITSQGYYLFCCDNNPPIPSLHHPIFRSGIERYYIVLQWFLRKTRCHGWKSKGENLFLSSHPFYLFPYIYMFFFLPLRLKQCWGHTPLDKIKLPKRGLLSFVLSTMSCHWVTTMNKHNFVCTHWARLMRNVKFVLTCILSSFKYCCIPFLHNWVPMPLTKVHCHFF